MAIKRRVGVPSGTPIVLTGVGGLVLGLLIGFGAGHSSKTATAPSNTIVVTTAPDAPSTAPAAQHSPSASQASAPAKVGGSIALVGMRGDEKLTVTLVKVADPATSSDQYMHPDTGKHWVAVQIRITNTAATAYSDSPDNGATLAGLRLRGPDGPMAVELVPASPTDVRQGRIRLRVDAALVRAA